MIFCMNIQLSETDRHTDRYHLGVIVQGAIRAGFSHAPVPHRRDATEISWKKKDNGQMTGVDYLAQDMQCVLGDVFSSPDEGHNPCIHL